jgi:hypothetical protein
MKYLSALILVICSTWVWGQQKELWISSEKGGVHQIGTLLGKELDNQNSETTAHHFKRNTGYGPALSYYTASNGKSYGTHESDNYPSTTLPRLWEYDQNVDSLKILYVFNNAEPRVMGELTHGILWGISTSGGTNNRGFLFQYNLGTAKYSVLLHFNKHNISPIHASAIKADNFIYVYSWEGQFNNQSNIIKYNWINNNSSIEYSTSGPPMGALVLDSSKSKIFFSSGNSIKEYDLSAKSFNYSKYLDTAICGIYSTSLIYFKDEFYLATRKGRKGFGAISKYNPYSRKITHLIDLDSNHQHSKLFALENEQYIFCNALSDSTNYNYTNFKLDTLQDRLDFLFHSDIRLENIYTQIDSLHWRGNSDHGVIELDSSNWNQKLKRGYGRGILGEKPEDFVFDNRRNLYGTFGGPSEGTPILYKFNIHTQKFKILQNADRIKMAGISCKMLYDSASKHIVGTYLYKNPDNNFYLKGGVYQIDLATDSVSYKSWPVDINEASFVDQANGWFYGYGYFEHPTSYSQNRGYVIAYSPYIDSLRILRWIDYKLARDAVRYQNLGISHDGDTTLYYQDDNKIMAVSGKSSLSFSVIAPSNNRYRYFWLKHRRGTNLLYAARYNTMLKKTDLVEINTVTKNLQVLISDSLHSDMFPDYQLKDDAIYFKKEAGNSSQMGGIMKYDISQDSLYWVHQFDSTNGFQSHFEVLDVCRPAIVDQLNLLDDTICSPQKLSFKVDSHLILDNHHFNIYVNDTTQIYQRSTNGKFQVQIDSTTTIYVRGDSGCAPISDWKYFTVTIDSGYSDSTRLNQTICYNGNYIFPDGDTMIGIKNTISDTSILQASRSGCDSVVITRLIPSKIESNNYDTLCTGSYFIRPTGDTLFNITTDLIDTAILRTYDQACDSFIYTQVLVDSLNLAVDRVNKSIWNTELRVKASNYTYQWFDCDSMQLIQGANSRIFTATKNGRYAVILDDLNCRDTSNCYPINSPLLTIVLHKPDSISDSTMLKGSPLNKSKFKIRHQHSIEVSIWPNPTVDHVQITSPMFNNLQIRLFDFQGKLLFEGKMSQDPQHIKLPSSTGLYLLEVLDRQGNYTTRYIWKK